MLFAFDIPRFSILLDLPLLVLVFVAVLAKTLHWVYQTDQDDVPKNNKTASQIMFRMSVIAAAIGGFCYLTGIAFWFFAIVVGVLVLGVSMHNVFGIFGLPVIAIGFLIREYVLGFPGWILSPKDRSEPTSTAELHPMIGQTAVTSAPLRPQGEIRIDGKKFPASSDSGRMIDSGVAVCVVGAKNGNLIVAEFEDDNR